MTSDTLKSATVTPEREAATGNRAQAGCCGGAAPEGADACCVLDAEIKSAGGSGCGCAPRAANGATRKGGCC